MNLIDLIIMLVVLVMFAGAAYFAYKKIVVEGGLFDTTTTSTEPVTSEPTSSLDTPGEVAGGVSGVDNMKGRPGSAASNSGKKYFGGGDKLIPDGDAKTADVCRDYSRTMGVNNWGWDRRNKSCFAYLDGSILTAMGEKEANKVEGKSQYIVGCTEPGLQVLDGCYDLNKGNVMRGYTYDANTGNVHDYGTGNKVMSAEACRAYANENGFEAFAIRTLRHGSVDAHGSCFFYKDAEVGLTGSQGSNSDIYHMTFCTDPSKKIIDGCQ